MDCGHQIAQLFKICHEQLKSSLNQSSYLWSASPRANLSRTSSNILSPRTVITCLMGRQEQKRTVYNTIPCIQKTTTTRKKKLFKYYDPCKYNQKFSKSNLNFILFPFIQLQLFARATTFFRQSAGFSLGLSVLVENEDFLILKTFQKRWREKVNSNLPRAVIKTNPHRNCLMCSLFILFDQSKDESCGR